MYKHYYVNRDNNGNPNYDHEVHAEDCYWLPKPEKRIYLGYYASCSDAVRAARSYYPNVDGCAVCCPQCHKS